MDTNTLSQAGGIYQWRQLSTNRRYIGSTNNFLKRYRDHLSALERRNHHNRHFNHAWHKYGATDFIFEIKEKCLKRKRLEGFRKGYADQVDKGVQHDAPNL